MIYSFSEGKMFRRCQRSWYFGKRLANALAKDSVRRNAYLLGKLQSIAAWRGKVVDQVIEKVVVPSFQYRRPVTLAPVLREARARFDSQLDFALNRRLWAPGFRAGDHEDDLAAFFCIEYGHPPTQDDTNKAWAEIEAALTNLLQSPKFHEIRESMRSADRLVSQCTIMHKYAGVTVRAIPDLVCFYRAAPPLIVDWKVHFFGVHDYYQQLVNYAIALTNCGPHKALPDEYRRCQAHDIRLVEAQLLTDEARVHTITAEDIAAVEDRMALEIQQILMAVDGREAKELSADDFPTTNRIGTCDTCNFKKLCWEN